MQASKTDIRFPRLLASILRVAVAGLVATVALAQEPGAVPGWGALQILDRSVTPGSKSMFPLAEDRNFDSAFINSSVWVVHGAQAGPSLCITAGIHGDEINSVEIARRVFSSLEPKQLRGSVILLPMINLSGIRSGERYMADRRDLNRLFPGRHDGSLSSIVARGVFELVTAHCRALIDLHTGSFARTNVPQIRVTSERPGALDMARHFGSGVVVLGDGPRGSLRREASEAGVDAIIYEAAGPHRFDAEAARVGFGSALSSLFCGVSSDFSEDFSADLSEDFSRMPSISDGVSFSATGLSLAFAPPTQAKPPLRPDAPQPTPFASTTATSAPKSLERWSAADNPV